MWKDWPNVANGLFALIGAACVYGSKPAIVTVTPLTLLRPLEHDPHLPSSLTQGTSVVR